MLRIIKYFEKGLIWGILIVLSIILILAFIDIVFEIKQNIEHDPKFIIDAEGLMNLFSIFLVLLIGLELLETLKAYLKDDIVHVEFIILVAIIAISRKVIVWDFKKYSNEELISLAVMVLALGLTYFLIKRSDVNKKLFKSRKKNNPGNN
ncbi:MAG: phosphate-starvation-inducible PsiE family protein [Bacteroidales bacterium]|nr:phosphate-starvation-inducible PsiE family protein [Bacteroidales bacterium]MBN2821312.1 phosphate-starvation-inducible PsiE family protein [Bacteroidales bacterium]